MASRGCGAGAERGACEREDRYRGVLFVKKDMVIERELLAEKNGVDEPKEPVGGIETRVLPDESHGEFQQVGDETRWVDVKEHLVTQDQDAVAERPKERKNETDKTIDILELRGPPGVQEGPQGRRVSGGVGGGVWGSSCARTEHQWHW